MSNLDTEKLIYDLCRKFITVQKNNTSIIYNTSLALLNDDKPNFLDETDEFYVLEKLKKLLISENKNDEVLRLEELYLDLKSSGRIKQPISLLIFFYTLKQSMDTKADKLSLLKSKFLLPRSTPFPNLYKDNKQLEQQQYINLNRKHDNQDQLFCSYSDSYSAFNDQYFGKQLNNYHNQNLNQFQLNGIQQSTFNNNQLIDNNELILRKQFNKQPRPYTIHVDNCKNEFNSVSNAELFREILLAFQGFNGRILEQNASDNNIYRINSNYKIDLTTKTIVLRLSNIGWLFNKINKYCDRVSKNESAGHVCKSFAFALQNELNSYLKLITIIEQQLHFSLTNNLNSYPFNKTTNDSSSLSSHSFLRLQTITFDSFNCLKSLANLIDQCKAKRGGELINEVYKCTQHGDPLIKNTITKLLTSILIPLRKFLSNWLFYGELDDQYKEFFITNSRSNVSSLFWHERYCINENMLPAFITLEQAQKVLATGKAVNVLKQISDTTKLTINYYDKMKTAFENSNIEELFNETFSYNKSYFQRQLTLAYKETNQNALKILNESYNFQHHLEGLKLFLLLGQGDFIRYLMDLLEPILNKSAKELKNNKLTNFLSYAIRSTNAQYLIDDVIDRLDIHIQEKSTDDNGWDMFSLVYKTKGPISIVFTQQCMENYSILFKYLWRSKRMEFILTSLLEKRMFYNRKLRNIPELISVFHVSNILLTEMVHFIKQMQYYLKFEVIECSWVIMQKRINEAEDLDQLIKAQEDFLSSVIYRTMLDKQSKSLSSQLRAIYDAIIDFQNIQNDLFGHIEFELERREQYDKLSKDQINNKQIILEEFNKKNEFKNVKLFDIKIKIQTLSRTYENMVQKFLIQLAEHCESDLRCLSVRLDFNEYYKKRNKSLECSFTYKKTRE